MTTKLSSVPRDTPVNKLFFLLCKRTVALVLFISFHGLAAHDKGLKPFLYREKILSKQWKSKNSGSY